MNAPVKSTVPVRLPRDGKRLDILERQPNKSPVVYSRAKAKQELVVCSRPTQRDGKRVFLFASCLSVKILV
jgi:hypothetical protein